MTQPIFNLTESLEALLEKAIRNYDTKNVLSADVRKWMSRSLAEFNTLCIAQFVAGQEKYQSDFLSEVDHRREAQCEIADLVWYLAGIMERSKHE